MAQQVKAHLVEPNDLGWILGPAWGKRTDFYRLSSGLHTHAIACMQPAPQTHTNVIHLKILIQLRLLITKSIKVVC